jgi:hypothetical protein
MMENRTPQQPHLQYHNKLIDITSEEYLVQNLKVRTKQIGVSRIGVDTIDHILYLP